MSQVDQDKQMEHTAVPAETTTQHNISHNNINLFIHSQS